MKFRVRMNLAMLLLVAAQIFSPSSQAASAQDEHGNWSSDLEKIGELSQKMCGSFFDAGSHTRITGEVSGSAAVPFWGKAFADVGGKAAGEVATEHWSGVVQEELAKSNATVSACNQHILDAALAYKAQTARQSAAASVPSPPPSACGNSIVYYHPRSSNQYVPQSVFTCKDGRTPAPVKLTDAATRILVEEQTGKLEATLGSDKIEWPTLDGSIYTIGIKNTGKTAIYVDGIKLVGGDLSRLASPSNFFPQKFVVRPGEVTMIPTALLRDIAPLLDRQYNDALYRYTASDNANFDCGLDMKPEVNSFKGCEGEAIGFAISINYVDTFGQKGALNTLAFLDRWRETS